MHRRRRPDCAVDDAHLAAIHHTNHLPHLPIVSLLVYVKILGIHGISNKVGEDDVVAVEYHKGALFADKFDYGLVGLADTSNADTGLMLTEDDGGIDDVRALLEDDVERAGVDGGGKGIKIAARTDVDCLGGSSSLAKTDIETVLVLTLEGGSRGGSVFRRSALHLFEGRLLGRLTSSFFLVVDQGMVGGCLKLGGDATVLLEALFDLLYMRGLAKLWFSRRWYDWVTSIAHNDGIKVISWSIAPCIVLLVNVELIVC